MLRTTYFFMSYLRGMASWQLPQPSGDKVQTHDECYASAPTPCPCLPRWPVAEIEAAHTRGVALGIALQRCPERLTVSAVLVRMMNTPTEFKF